MFRHPPTPTYPLTTENTMFANALAVKESIKFLWTVLTQFMYSAKKRVPMVINF